jgi:hypothetical protein
VREAAIKALARLGNAGSIPVLAAILKEGGPTGSEANKALLEVQGVGVTAALIRQSSEGDLAVREAFFKVLAERGEVEAVPLFRKAILDPDVRIRQAALKPFGLMGTKEDLDNLLAILVAKKDVEDSELLSQTIREIAGRMSDPAARTDPILRALSKADVPTQVILLGVLSTLGGETALRAVRTSLSGDPEVRKAAVRALADWPEPAAMPDLLELTRGKEKSDQILALRGFIRLAALTPSKTRIQAYREAMNAAERREEKWLVLSGLAGVAQVESLKMVEPCLEDPAVQREAFAAYEKIAESLANRQPAAAKEALEAVAAKATDNNLRAKAQAALEKMNHAP